MANGTTPGQQGPWDKRVELLQRAGKWGQVALGCFMLQAIAGFSEQAMGWHSWKDFFHSLWDLSGNLGIGLALVGGVASIKRNTDMTATIGAESSVARAVIASAIGGQVVIPSSSDPVVNKEIAKQLNGKMEALEKAAASKSNSGT